MDWKGLQLVCEGKAGRQIPTSGCHEVRYDQRYEAIAAARSLGVPYRVTPLSVIIGLPPRRKYIPPTQPFDIPEVVASAPKPHKRTVLWANNPQARGAVRRVNRTSREDIE